MFQWLSRHFNDKNFSYDINALLENKLKAVETLNKLLSEKLIKRCASCGCEIDDKSKFAICEECFKNRRFQKHRGQEDVLEKDPLLDLVTIDLDGEVTQKEKSRGGGGGGRRNFLPMNVVDFCESILTKGSLEDKFLSPDVVTDYEYKKSTVPSLPVRDKKLSISAQRQSFQK